MTKELAGRVAIVTGAGRNIGRGIALALADGGAAVVVNARSNLQEAEAVAGEIERMYGLFPILKEKRLLLAGTLSGGQQQMLAMARALMGRPQLLLLDEPSMGLAPLLIAEIFRIVAELRDRGITIFLVEQNAHAALSIADVGYVIETGAITLSGPGPELLHNEQVQSAYLGM